MDNKIRIIAIITSIIFAASGIAILLCTKQSDKSNVEVIQDGEILYRFDLSIAENQTIKINSTDGSSCNVICIENGTIRISNAECPDRICVKMGTLKSEGVPIVCLPNKLVIRFCEEE